MTISTYQVDSVIRAYSKHHKSRGKAEVYGETPRDQKGDMVTLSGNHESGTDFYTKVSYSLLDAIRKQRPAL
ncbi:MAG: hypothetical protein N2Z74_05605 [Syntrophales bacterium]|nr:hypothetical protein [Syntrophales bacterium]